MHHGRLLAVDTTEHVMANEDGPGGLPRRAAVTVTEAPSPLLSVRDLHVYLGPSHVLQGVSFDVAEGGVTALLGRNGVGKTTTHPRAARARPAARAA